MEPTLQEADGTLVVDGRVRDGSFRLPFRTPDFERVDLTGRGPFVPLLRARQRFWFGFALTHPEVHLATIAIDLGVAVVSSFYVVERATGAFYERQAFGVGKRGRVAKQPWDDESHVHARGHRVDFRHHVDAHRHEIRMDCAANARSPAIHVDLVMHEDVNAIPPLVTSIPTEGRWFMYTHKAHAPASGQVRIGDRTYLVYPSRDLLSLDEHKAAYPYVQEWTWGSFAGRLPDGRLVAANLCTNVRSIDEEHGNENRIWLGDRMEALGKVHFELDPRAVRTPWRIRDSRGRVDLVFTPQGRKEQHTGAGPYRLDYFQAYGTYRGTLVDAQGTAHAIDDLWGVAEQGIGRN